jgi:ribokinase
VFFVSGDVEALRSARAARVLAATLRERPTLSEGAVTLDLLVGSLNDAGERYDNSLDAKIVVLTDGGKGGTVNGERFAAADLPGEISDAYGAGDSFAAALLVGLARGEDVSAAVRLGARAGAAVITGRGPYTAQLTS